MKTPHRKILGIVLITASLALFCWLAYEPAQIASTLRLGAVVDEAAVVIAALAITTSTLATGAFLVVRSSPRR